MARRSKRSRRNRARREAQLTSEQRPAAIPPTQYESNRKFTLLEALHLLSDRGLIDYYDKQLYNRKQYWTIQWSHESVATRAAICATQYRDHCLNVPFGLQDELLRRGIVDEVLLVCRLWNHLFRIPSAAFRTFDTTLGDDNRRYFQVNRDRSLSSNGTAYPISLSQYAFDLPTREPYR